MTRKIEVAQHKFAHSCCQRFEIWNLQGGRQALSFLPLPTLGMDLFLGSFAGLVSFFSKHGFQEMALFHGLGCHYFRSIKRACCVTHVYIHQYQCASYPQKMVRRGKQLFSNMCISFLLGGFYHLRYGHRKWALGPSVG